jgi:N-acylneuraminate cytidylyltransferase
MHIAVIPARGGSKRIPGKNTRYFLGKPMLQLTIEKIHNLGMFDSIYVSTEDSTISQIAIESGARIHRREVDLSDDFASTLDVIHSTVEHLQGTNVNEDDFVTCVYPVTPLLKPHHLTQAFELLEKTTGGYVFAGQDQSAQIGRSFMVNKKGNLEMMFPTQERMRTQDVPKIYSDAGLFYMGKASTWLSKVPIFSPQSKIIEIGKFESVDIDTEEDWKFVEELFEIRSKNQLKQ